MTSDNSVERLMEVFDHLSEEQDRLTRRLDAVNADIEAIGRSLVLLNKTSTPVPRASQRRGTTIDVDRLHGLDLEGVAIAVARDNGGMLKFTATRKVMVRLGLLESGNTGSTKLYALLNGSPHFEKGAMRGEYRLKRNVEAAAARSISNG